jgi:hypothetical protein
LLANVGVGATGGRLSFSGFRSRSNPREPVVDRDDDYLRDRASIAFARPFAELSAANLPLTAALDLDDLEILRSGDRMRDERLRMFSIGPHWSWRQEAAPSASSAWISCRARCHGRRPRCARYRG